jgi:hypothetical protein
MGEAGGGSKYLRVKPMSGFWNSWLCYLSGLGNFLQHTIKGLGNINIFHIFSHLIENHWGTVTIRTPEKKDKAHVSMQFVRLFEFVYFHNQSTLLNGTETNDDMHLKHVVVLRGLEKYVIFRNRTYFTGTVHVGSLVSFHVRLKESTWLSDTRGFIKQWVYTKTLITNKCTKRVLSSVVTHSYMFRPCWVVFRENFFYRSTRVALYSWVRMCSWLCTALFFEAWTLRGPGLNCGPGLICSSGL